ncbi:hypothetical protein [Gordonia sp. NPDC003376]
MVFIGGIGIGGTDEAGNEFTTLAALPLDMRLSVGRLSQRAIEDQQFWQLMIGAELLGIVSEITSYTHPDTDPPDLVVSVGDDTFNVELTSITAPQVSRQRLAEVRSVGRRLSERLTGTPDRYSHLVGKQVWVFDRSGDDTRLPRRAGGKLATLIDAIARELETDFGVVSGIPPNPDGTIPQSVPASIVQRGRREVEGYYLEIHPDHANPSAPAMATGMAQITIETARLEQEFLSRIAKKDRGPNDILIITTGLPDDTGYACPADHFVYNTLARRIRQGLLKPPATSELRQVIFNHHGSIQDVVFLDTNLSGARFVRQFDPPVPPAGP